MLDGTQTRGIVIGFTDEVQVSATIDGGHVFQVLAPSPDNNCLCLFPGRTIPVKLKLDSQNKIIVNSDGRIDSATELPPGNARGVAFIPYDPRGNGILRNGVNSIIINLSIILRGDFVLDRNGRAIDAEFVRAQLPTGDRANGSSFGVQGGLFESWFQIRAFITGPESASSSARAKTPRKSR
jgi:hypothetical protein